MNHYLHDLGLYNLGRFEGETINDPNADGGNGGNRGGNGGGSGCGGCLMCIIGYVLVCLIILQLMNCDSSDSRATKSYSRSSSTVAVSASAESEAADSASAGNGTSAVTAGTTAPAAGAVSAGTADTAAVAGTATVASPDAATDADVAAAATDGALVEIPRLPTLGMDAAYLDQTELGVHDEVGPVISGNGQYAGGTPYYWLSKNGKGDRVFEAIVRDGTVIKVIKWNATLNYWSDGGIVAMDFPDLYASGEKVEVKAAEPTLYSPLDYDSPEAFADDNQAYFTYQGSADGWADAYAYWEGQVG